MVMVGGFVLGQMVTDWSRTFPHLIFWKPRLVNGTLDLLIKSQPFLVYRRA